MSSSPQPRPHMIGVSTRCGAGSAAVPPTPEILPPNVELVGEVDDVAPDIAAATVFVCPSRFDSFPLVVLEAMALARPLVASRIPGIEEQLGDTGLLVKPGDISGLLAAVERLLVDSDERRSLGERAQSRCRDRWDVPVFRAGVRDIANSVRRGT